MLVDDRAVAHSEPVSARAGSTVTVGRTTTGVRSYLAVGGGIAVPLVLGSRSTDTLAWIGPTRLQGGDVLPLGTATGVPAPADVGVRRTAGRILHVSPGPRADWIGEAAWQRLDGARYTVDAASNRIGLRLNGPVIDRARTDELASEGIVLGGVQLPPSGQPVVFLHDHPVTGGYPVIAIVDPADLAICAQLRPGAEVELRVQSSAGRSAGASAGSSIE